MECFGFSLIYRVLNFSISSENGRGVRVDKGERDGASLVHTLHVLSLIDKIYAQDPDVLAQTYQICEVGRTFKAIFAKE